MFRNIVESVLNEISAEDAYNKFYSDLPRDEFNSLLEIYGGKFDLLIKAILKSIKEESNGENLSELFINARKLLQHYKSVQNEVRIKFNQNLKNGEYDDVLDMEQGLNELSSQGVDTSKSFQKNGLIMLIDDENYRITCTTTYEANHHFYGKSKWCTASDRFGRYDGWKYFLVYVYGFDIDLVDEIGDFNFNKHTPVASLVQFTDKAENKTYQIQLFSNAKVGDICDFENDEQLDISGTNMPEELMELLFEKATELVFETKKAQEKEIPYQISKNRYVEEKREKTRQKIDRLLSEYNNVVKEENTKKANFVQNKFNELINSKLLENIQFLTQVCRFSGLIYKNGYEDIDDREDIVNLEEQLKQVKYATVASTYASETNNIMAIRIEPAIGLTKEVDYSSNGMPFIRDKFAFESYVAYTTSLKGGAVVIVKTSTKNPPLREIEIESVIKISKETNMDLKARSLYNMAYDGANYTGGAELNNYFIISHGLPEKPIAEYSELFNANTLKTISLKGSYEEAIIYDDILILRKNTVAYYDYMFVFDKNTLKLHFTLKVKRTIPRGFGWYLGKNEETDDMYLIAHEFVNLGKLFKGIDFANIVGNYENGVLHVYDKTHKDNTTVTYDFKSNKITQH